MPAAYSYLRFSSPAQATGDSIRRQIESREKWLAAHPEVSLDVSLKMTDAGRSAFRRKNGDTYALAQFVAHIKSGRVEQGSYLLVENLDRLSREGAGEATELFLSIVNKGITIVQLSPAVLEFRHPVDMMNLMFAIVELSRGHGESAVKSERIGAAWARKHREIGSRTLTRRLPTWIRAAGGEGKEIKHTAPGEVRLELIPEKAAVVRRIFALAAVAGTAAIAATLNSEGVATLGRKLVKGRAVVWDSQTVNYILKSRAALGEFVPHKEHDAKSPGEPIRGYFPAVVDEATFYAAQSALARRATVGRGRKGKHVNLFGGLLLDARDGGTLTYRHNTAPQSVIVPTGAIKGRGRVSFRTFPAVVFETAVLSKLVELKASDVIESTDANRSVGVLAAQAEQTSALIRAWQAKMDDVSIVDTVAAKLSELGAKHKTECEQLAVAQREAASPMAEALGGLSTLAELLASDSSDELRLKIRAALQRCIDRVHCVFGGGIMYRLAALRVQFVGTDAHRDYLILHENGHARPKRTARTHIIEDRWDAARTELDLRNPADAAVVEKWLATVDVEKLAAAIAEATRKKAEKANPQAASAAPGRVRKGK